MFTRVYLRLPLLLVFTYVYSCLPMFNRVFIYLLLLTLISMYIYQLLLVLNNVLHFFTYVYPWLLVLPMVTLVYLCLPLFTRGYTCLQLFTRSCLLHVFLCLPMFTFV